ncbi:hypothetical protein FCH28_23580 [Streptomyces piniterrae]|uniref:Uncharacterized protein n=1 Tax=Streptomyces piniterrae TaxID=2571125 RepID=A0A4U0N9B4_9ACTN|nr:hypothetical protein [Streptomyces piniterrae]TJZ50276.1 hypothetical protein FCH28_23580 [Streptomyces piniterrae]
MQRVPHPRLIALAGTVVLAVAVPLAAATAGPADGLTSDTRPDRAAERTKTDKSVKPAAARGAGDTVAGKVLADLGLPLLPEGRRTTRCGPELASPQGIEAQTCVLAERGLTWARTYYRNPTGAPLRAVLTLLRPDGRTIQVHCEVAAEDVPGMCETPTGATVRKDRLPYGAVAEIADAAGERLLLRSGGNSAPHDAGSGR